MFKTFIILLFLLSTSCASRHKLFVYSYQNNLPGIKKEIENGADINMEDSIYHNYTPLIIAISRNYFKVSKYLLENGAKLPKKGKYNDTVLHHTSRIRIMKLLLKHGADINAFSIYNDTPLMRHNHDPEVVQFLIDNNANVNLVDRKGRTALVMAQRDLYNFERRNNRDKSESDTKLISNVKKAIFILQKAGAGFEKVDRITSKTSQVVVGKVFKVTGRKVVLLRNYHRAERPGRTYTIFKNKKPIASIKVNAVFHTKLNATITSGSGIIKGLKYGYIRTEK